MYSGYGQGPTNPPRYVPDADRGNLYTTRDPRASKAPDVNAIAKIDSKTTSAWDLEGMYPTNANKGGQGNSQGGSSSQPSQAPKQTPSQTGGIQASYAVYPEYLGYPKGGNITTQAMIPSEMGSPPQPTQDTGGTVTTTAFPENWDVRQVGPAPGQPVSQPQPPQKPPRQTTPPGQMEKMPPAQRRPQQPPHQRPQHPQQGAIPVPQGQYPVQSPAYGNWQVNNQQMNQWMQQMQQMQQIQQMQQRPQQQPQPQPQQQPQQPQQQQPQPQLHEYRLDTSRPAVTPTYGMQPYWANQMAPWGQPPVQPGTPSPYWQRSIPFNQQGGY